MARRGGEGRIRFANQTALYFLLFAFSNEEKVSKRREESVKLICREKGKEEERKEEKRKGEGGEKIGNSMHPRVERRMDDFPSAGRERADR